MDDSYVYIYALMLHFVWVRESDKQNMLKDLSEKSRVRITYFFTAFMQTSNINKSVLEAAIADFNSPSANSELMSPSSCSSGGARNVSFSSRIACIQESESESETLLEFINKFWKSLAERGYDERYYDEIITNGRLLSKSKRQCNDTKHGRKVMGQHCKWNI